MNTKSKFITISPKNEVSTDFFNVYLKKLHSCKVLREEHNQFKVKSIAGNYVFWVNKTQDNNWKIVK